MRREPTNVERRLWSKLRDRQLAGVHFRRQHPVDPYIADFAAPSWRLIVELDGSQHADNQSDRIRDAYLRKQGWHILRFWNNEVNESLEGVLMVILDWLRQAPTLTLPRKRERE